jgi:hypothetical protein
LGFESLAARTISPGQKLRSRIPMRICVWPDGSGRIESGLVDDQVCGPMVARPVACNTRDVAGPVLLERERELAELAQAAQEAAAGEGGLVLVSGEAGIGKSSLVRSLHGLLPAGGRLLVGHCDDLGTPRTLGPFHDLVGQVGAELTRALRKGGERDAVPAALRAELDWAGHPAVPVVEDAHWADEATLDVLPTWPAGSPTSRPCWC